MKLKEILVPTMTLVIITLVITGLLVFTNDLTKDKIAALQVQADEDSKKDVLSTAEGFETKVIDVDGEEFEYYEASNEAGYVFSTQYKGYGGAVVVMTGISSDGNITGVKVTEQNETPGLGQKALSKDFTDQYIMSVPDSELIVTKSGKTKDIEIDAISGATITSTAVTNSVNQAISIYHTIIGGGN